jgi:hypothetical protein
MRSRQGFSGQNLGLTDIAYYYSDTEQALRAYFARPAMSADPRFVGYAPSDVLQIRLDEHDYSSALTILPAVEAAVKIDYLERVSQKLKDNLSREFRQLYRRKERRASLEDDILDIWREHGGVNAKLIGELKGAFKYRHWLAHGRYWVPKLARKYDYVGVYTLADEIFRTLPLVS